MPADFMSMSTNVMPCCFLGIREVRTRPNIQLGLAGVCGPDLAAGTHQVIAVVDRRHRQRRQVRTRLGFGVALAEEHLAGQDAGRKNFFCAGVPNAMIACATIRIPIGDNDGAPASVDSRLKM